MKSKSTVSLVTGACLILATGSMVGPGVFRWVLFSIGIVIGVILTTRVMRNERKFLHGKRALNSHGESENISIYDDWINKSNWPEVIKSALRELSSLEVSSFSKAPVFHRMAWRIGVEIPPPLFAGFLINLLLMSVVFGVLWGFCIFSLIGLSGERLLVSARTAMLCGTAGASVLFGLTMASYFWVVARKHRLPSWSEFRVDKD